jgi:alkylation response protein AidB-like acyl-CoA dehydrogenase
MVFAVASTAPGLAWTDAPMLDITRRFADVHVEGLEVGAVDLIAQGAEAEQLIVDLLNRAALATACDAFGVAEQALQMTVAYAKERVQFDRPIGSFQAVKHRCADMFIAVETARAVLDDAIDAYDAAPDSAAVAISRAKAYCCDATAQVTEDAVELHGGIGFTWEHDLHLYVKRVRLDQALFGDSRWHRRRVAALTLD